jgi:hypothetical protein
METTEERWFRWDKLINEGKYIQLIKEFDSLYAKKENLTIGDLVRRDEALEFIGIPSIVKERVKRQEVKKHGSRRGKS